MILISQPTVKGLVNTAKDCQNTGMPMIFAMITRQKETEPTGVEYNTLVLTVSAVGSTSQEIVLAYRSNLLTWTSYRGEPDLTDKFDKLQQVLDAGDILIADVLSLIGSTGAIGIEGEITIPGDLLKTFCHGRRFVKWEPEAKFFEVFEEGDDPA